MDKKTKRKLYMRNYMKKPEWRKYRTRWAQADRDRQRLLRIKKILEPVNQILGNIH